MLSIYCPFEVEAIVILIFHGRRWRQKRLSNLPQVPVAFITAFFMVAWQRFLSWQKPACPFLFILLSRHPLLPLPSRLHHKCAAGQWGAPLPKTSWRLLIPLSVGPQTSKLIFHLMAQILLPEAQAGNVWHSTLVRSLFSPVRDPISLSSPGDPEQGAAATAVLLLQIQP